MSLYKSREGILYNSYDNFVGQVGFYDGTEDEPGKHIYPVQVRPWNIGPIDQCKICSFILNTDKSERIVDTTWLCPANNAAVSTNPSTYDVDPAANSKLFSTN